MCGGWSAAFFFFVLKAGRRRSANCRLFFSLVPNITLSVFQNQGAATSLFAL